MLHVIGCITQQHDLRLVALAAVLCLLACFTAASMVLRGRAANGRARWWWLGAAGMVFGCGIWATHFVAMLAYRAGLPVEYDGALTLLSVVVAIAVSSAGFAVALERSALLGGALAGIAIGAMHYIGMAAVRIPAHVVWDFRYLIASVLLGVGLCAIALLIVLRRGSIGSLATGAGFLAAAIVAMHFTGMAAATYYPTPGIVVPRAFMDPTSLAVAIAAAGILIVALGLTGAVVDYHLAHRAKSETETLKKHIAELESTKNALEATSQDLSDALSVAESANAAKAQFLASMSHELRTPLNAIIGFSDFLLLEAFGPIGSPRYVEYVRDIRQSGTLLLALINDILDLSRLDADQTVLKDDALDLSEIVSEAARMLRMQALEAAVTVSEDVAEASPRVRGDRRRILQVLLNLLSNAIKFTPAGGSIRIQAYLSAGEMAVAVCDTGIGISKENVATAFERFGQVDSRLSRKYQGAGLGLPLAKQLIELHGGRLVLESEPNRGTTVTITFPPHRLVAAAREVA